MTFFASQNFNFLDSESVRVLATDFSKAFDKLPFPSIISSFVNLGVAREPVLLVTNFLSNRLQRVSFQGSCSDVTFQVVCRSEVFAVLFFFFVSDGLPICFE